MIDFDQMIEDSVDSLVNGNPKQAAESLVEIAQAMSKAGYPERGFASLRSHIIAEAIRKSDEVLVNERLREAEKELQRARAFH